MFSAVGGSAAQRAAAIGPQALTVLCAAAIAAQCAVLAWKFVPGATRPPPPPVAAPRAADLGPLIAAHLFGAAAQVSGADAPRTRVALVLAGTLAALDPKQGLAIIGESAQAAHVYAVGASLPGGVRLHEVYPDRVVLERDGALETLPLPRQFTGGVGPAAPAQFAGGATAAPALGESVQRLIAQGPDVIGDLMRPMPTYANGQLKGFRLYPGRDRGKFAKLGLQPGDLVTQINGVPLADAQHGMEILRSLGNAGSANVTVERGGSTQQITVDASQVANVAGRGDPAAGAPQTPPPGAATSPSE
jgi:general secretion pathway protein C